MNKITIITTIFVLSIIATSSNANASLFSWRNSYVYSQIMSSDIHKDWVFMDMANKSADTLISKQAIDAQQKAEEEKELTIVKTYTVRATAYSSTADQTDSTPFITASGAYVKDRIIAANFLPFGTIVRIPEIYGDKLFVVEDRMHERYWYNVDIWFSERNLAKEFGAKKVRIEVVAVNDLN